MVFMASRPFFWPRLWPGVSQGCWSTVIILSRTRQCAYPRMLATTRNIMRNRFEVLQGTSRMVFMIPDYSPSDQACCTSPRGDRKESRKFRRISVELPCWFSGDGPHEWTGTAVNLSSGGCAIRSTTPVQQGQFLRVLLFLSANQTPIEVREAPVRWAANEHFGLEFMTLTSRDASRLQHLLTSSGA